MRRAKYPIEVFWSDEDEAYIAIAPDLPGCSAAGDTEEEALKEVHVAIYLWLETAKEMRRAIPEPSPPMNFAYSGKFLMRVPKTLHSNLVRLAKVEGVSLNQYVLYLLSKPKVAFKKSALKTAKTRVKTIVKRGASVSHR